MPPNWLSTNANDYITDLEEDASPEAKRAAWIQGVIQALTAEATAAGLTPEQIARFIAGQRQRLNENAAALWG